MPYLTFYYLKTEYWRLILTVFNGFNCIYREALHEASDELVEEVVEDKDVSSFGERLSCDTSATLLNCWDSLLLLELVKLVIVLERGLEVLRLRSAAAGTVLFVILVVVVFPVPVVLVLFLIRFRSSVNLA